MQVVRLTAANDSKRMPIDVGLVRSNSPSHLHGPHIIVGTKVLFDTEAWSIVYCDCDVTGAGADPQWPEGHRQLPGRLKESQQYGSALMFLLQAAFLLVILVVLSGFCSAGDDEEKPSPAQTEQRSPDPVIVTDMGRIQIDRSSRMVNLHLNREASLGWAASTCDEQKMALLKLAMNMPAQYGIYVYSGISGWTLTSYSFGKFKCH